MNQLGLWTTDIVKKHPVIVSDRNSTAVKNQLVPNIPVKTLHWFFRNTKFEDPLVVKEDEETEEGNFYIHNRFNFSSNVNFDQLNSFFDPVMESARFYIQGNQLPNIRSSNHAYFKYYVPFEKRLSRPIRNIYSYAFSMHPVNVQPSGSLDFSQLESNKTTIECDLFPTSETYSLHMYYTGYVTFRFANGFMTRAYSP